MEKGSSFDNFLDSHRCYNPLIDMDAPHSLAQDNAEDLIHGFQSISISNESPTNPFDRSRNLAGFCPNSQSPVLLPPSGFDGNASSSSSLFSSISNGSDPIPDKPLLSIVLRAQAQSRSIRNLSRGYGSRSLTGEILIPPTPTRSLSYGSFTRDVYYMAKDRRGCGELQRNLDAGRVYVDGIFDGVIEYLDELMKHPIANHLMQRLFEVCSYQQKNRILLTLTEEPDTLLSLALHTFGTRCVHKLIQNLESRQQIGLFFAALKPGSLDLIKHHTANPLIQHCLQNFPEDSKFILEAVSNHWVEMAIDKYGCYTLQNCLKVSSPEFQENLVPKIISKGLELAVHASGNYVIQFIVGMGNPVVNAHLANQFEGYYVFLSKQKFSSNVVEKCMTEFSEQDKVRIVLELLESPEFDQLLQHPIANYVILSAIQNTRGAPYAVLVEAIRPHYETLRSSPFCKKIFATLFKRPHAF